MSRRCKSRYIALCFVAVFLSACLSKGRDTEVTSQVNAVMAANSLQSRAVDGSHIFSFPADHGPHPDYLIEWWHVVADFYDENENRFGAQLTFFRRRIPNGETQLQSAWTSEQLYMAHFAVTDVSGDQHMAEEKFQRGGGLGLAGATDSGKKIWLNNWTLERIDNDNETWRLFADTDNVKVDLIMSSEDVAVLHGKNGFSYKGAGNVASYYYSLTDLTVGGSIMRDDNPVEITRGRAWIDREWSNGDGDEYFKGWIWLALWLDSGRELMLYRVYRNDSNASTFDYVVTIDGQVVSDIVGERFSLKEDTFCDTKSGARYLCGITLESTELGVLKIRPLVRDQSHKGRFKYWEGLVDVYSESGEVRGSGYFENTVSE